MTDTLTDAKGRVLTLRTLTVLDQVRIMRAIGAEQSQNAPYTSVVMAACTVSDIDGVPLPMPRNERDIDDRIVRVGDDGFAIITAHLRQQTQAVQDAAEAALAEGTKADPLAPSEASPNTATS